MPWHLEYGAAGCNDDEWAVVKDADGTIEGCHPTRADAVSQMQALYAAEPTAAGEPLAAAAIETGAPSGGMIAFMPTEADAERLALAGYEAADQLHCTSLYLGEAAGMDDGARKECIAHVAAAIAGVAPFDAQAFAVSAFNPAGEEPCVVLGLGGAELAAAQDKISAGCGMYEDPEGHHPWIPHITLAYDSEPYLLMGDETTNRIGPVSFDRVRIAFGDQVTDIPLGGEDPQAVDEPVDEDLAAAALVAAMVTGTPFDALLIPEGVWSGDGRMFEPGAIGWAEPPLPFKWQPEEGDGHEGSVIVGRIDEIWRDETSAIRIRGIFDDIGTNGAEALRLVRGQFLRGVSVSADDIEAADVELVWPQPDPAAGMEPPAEAGPELDVVVDEGGMPEMMDMPDMPDMEMPEPVSAPPATMAEMMGPEPKQIYHGGRIRSATLVAEPAFVESIITLPEVAAVVPTRVMVAAASAGSSWTITIPELWPEEWFDEPAAADMPEFGGLKITASGRITGFLAPPGVVHRAFRASGRPVTVPLAMDYSEFNNKPAIVAARDGGVARINAGNITFNCGHPDLLDPIRSRGPAAVREVYDNSCSVIARVRIWESPTYPGAPIVAGALLHGIDADAIERMMGCNLSGDWQGGKLNAALLVPVEGFPPSVAGSVRVREGQLVASSVPVHFVPRVRDQLESLAKRVGLDAETRFAQLRARVGGE